jgi:Na+-driven multidrug efflux pump
MAASAAVAIALELLTLAMDWGIAGIWAAMAALMAVRLATTAWRFADGRWALVGARVGEAPS